MISKQGIKDAAQDECEDIDKEIGEGGTSIRIAADTYEFLDQVLIDAIRKATRRCRANGRSTIKPQDL